MRDAKTYAVGNVPWLYPHRNPPPRGQKLALLTIGGIQTHGEWKDKAGYLGWQYLFRRDDEAEEEVRVFNLGETSVEKSKGFRVPRSLPNEPNRWTRIVSARWFDDASSKEVAAIFKLVDDQGYVTPITYQYDSREEKQFKSGYSIMNTEFIFDTWGGLSLYWPTYIDTLRKEGSEALIEKEMDYDED